MRISQFSFSPNDGHIRSSSMGPLFPSQLSYQKSSRLVDLLVRINCGRIGEAALQFRRLRPAALPVRLWLAGSLLVAGVFCTKFTSRDDIPRLIGGNTELPRASRDGASVCLQTETIRRRDISHERAPVGSPALFRIRFHNRITCRRAFIETVDARSLVSLCPVGNAEQYHRYNSESCNNSDQRQRFCCFHTFTIPDETHLQYLL